MALQQAINREGMYDLSQKLGEGIMSSLAETRDPEIVRKWISVEQTPTATETTRLNEAGIAIKAAAEATDSTNYNTAREWFVTRHARAGLSPLEAILEGSYQKLAIMIDHLHNHRRS